MNVGVMTWASRQICKIRGCACAGNAWKGFPPQIVSELDMHHGTCMTHMPWCMPGSLTGGFLLSRWRGKRSLHPRCMRNPQYYVSGKRPMEAVQHHWPLWGESIAHRSQNLSSKCRVVGDLGGLDSLVVSFYWYGKSRTYKDSCSLSFKDSEAVTTYFMHVAWDSAKHNKNKCLFIIPYSSPL